MPDARRLSDRGCQADQRLPIASPIRHPHGGAGLARRRRERGRPARLLLPAFARSGRRERDRNDRVPVHQHGRLWLPRRASGTNRRDNRARDVCRVAIDQGDNLLLLLRDGSAPLHCAAGRIPSRMTASPGQPMTVEQRNRETGLAIMKAIGEGDSASLFRMYAPNARFWQIGKHLKTAGWHDMEATGRMAAKVFARLASPPKMTILSTTAEGDRVAIEAESHGRLVDGRPYENQYHFLLRFDADGKVVEFKEYLDTLYVFETLFDGKTDL